MNEETRKELNIIGDSNYDAILESLDDVLFENSVDTLLELSIEKSNYKHSEIVSIIESEGLQINLFWKRDMGDIFHLYLLINSQDLRTIINTLQYRGYTILNMQNEQGYDAILKDRYDELMHYINI